MVLVGAAGAIVVVEAGIGRFTQHLLDDAGPSPYELLPMVLGSCTSMTLRLYAERHQWPLERVIVRLRHDRIHVEDCAECETEKGMFDRFER